MQSRKQPEPCPIGKREQLKIYDRIQAQFQSAFNLTRAGPAIQLAETSAQRDSLPRFRVDPYYTKFTWAREFTVVGRRASDEALLKANDTIRKMFAYRHDILKALMAEDLRLVVLGPGESLADLPEYSQMAEKGVDHTARYLEYTPGVNVLAVDQANVLSDLPRDPSATECQVIRVFAKALYHVTATRPVDPNWDKRGRDVQQYELRVQRMDVRFDDRLKTLYDDAMSRVVEGHRRRAQPRRILTGGVLAYLTRWARASVQRCRRPDRDASGPEGLRSGLFELVETTMACKGKVDWRQRLETAAMGYTVGMDGWRRNGLRTSTELWNKGAAIMTEQPTTVLAGLDVDHSGNDPAAPMIGAARAERRR